VNTFKLVIITMLLFIATMETSSASSAIFPKPVFSVLPMYPEEARSARVAGTVRIWFVLNGDGEVAQAGVASGPAMLQEAAMRSVRSWRFRPESLRSGVRCETKFVYVLNVQAKEGEPKLTVSMSDYRRVEVDSELSVVAVE
jgi:TonB family protein